MDQLLRKYTHQHVLMDEKWQQTVCMRSKNRSCTKYLARFGSTLRFVNVPCFRFQCPSGSLRSRNLERFIDLSLGTDNYNNFPFSIYFRLTARTAIDVEEGSKLYTTYTYTLSGTMVRQAALKSTKYFTCQCKRCLDPTELGTHFSSLKCQKCDNGVIVSSKPTGNPVHRFQDVNLFLNGGFLLNFRRGS